MHLAIAPLYQEHGYQLGAARAFKQALPRMVIERRAGSSTP